MRYGDQDRESQNVEDRRGQDSGPVAGRGMPFPLPMGAGRGLSIGTIVIIGVICLMLGINPLELLSGNGIPTMPDTSRTQPTQPTSQRSPFELPRTPGPRQAAPQNDEMSQFVRRVLADTEDVWERVFAASGQTYQKPTLVLFSRATQTACGTGMSAMGPFYCPLDRKLYIDLKFYEDLKTKFGAPGDFAQAYVIAHEVGHHVQTLLGVAEKVQSLKQRMDQARANAMQVRMELQADCLAGVWASLNDQLKKRLEAGDIQEGLNAASQIGDDTLQRRTQGQVVPESFTHGSSEQRVRWFKRGLETSQMKACDTFNAKDL